MELKFVFNGIETAGDGTYPRAVVRVQPDFDAWPYDSFMPRVVIELPLASLSGDVAQIGAAAVQAATKALSSAPLQAWIQAQPLRPREKDKWLQSMGGIGG